MRIRRVVPDLHSDDFEATKDFYIGLFEFDVVMDMTWVMTLASPSNPTAQVTFMRDDASAALEPNVSIEVADVDAAYENARKHGAQIVHPLTDEPWGVRRFFVIDPNDVVLNVLEQPALL
jgi:predicted enzyme related to lactoylglutathione lyase